MMSVIDCRKRRRQSELPRTKCSVVFGGWRSLVVDLAGFGI